MSSMVSNERRVRPPILVSTSLHSSRGGTPPRREPIDFTHRPRFGTRHAPEGKYEATDHGLAAGVSREPGRRVRCLYSPCEILRARSSPLVPRSLASVGRLRYVTRRHDASTHRRRGGWSTRLRSAAGLRRPTRSDLDRGLLGRCRLRRRDHSCHLDVERDRDRPAVRARATLDADRDLGAGRRPAGSEPDCRAASAPRSSARLTLPQGWPPNPAAGVHDSSRGNRPLDADLSSRRDRELALSFRVRTGGVL